MGKLGFVTMRTLDQAARNYRIVGTPPAPTRFGMSSFGICHTFLSGVLNQITRLGPRPEAAAWGTVPRTFWGWRGRSHTLAALRQPEAAMRGERLDLKCFT
jgi:hypothetical protein